jgi:hypothetical protein
VNCEVANISLAASTNHYAASQCRTRTIFAVADIWAHLTHSLASSRLTQYPSKKIHEICREVTLPHPWSSIRLHGIMVLFGGRIIGSTHGAITCIGGGSERIMQYCRAAFCLELDYWRVRLQLKRQLSMIQNGYGSSKIQDVSQLLPLI